MSEPAGEIGIGIVGLGWPGEQHAKAVAALPGARVTAACDLSDARRRAFAGPFAPGAAVYADYAALLADPAVDAVVVALPNFAHHAATVAALRAGKHVLCEKPPTLNVAEMEEIRSEAARAGRVYAFGRQSRFSSAVLAARDMIAAGALGEVYFVRGERVRSRGVPAWGGGWFLDAAKAGGGAMIDIGIHALDDAWFLLGCPAPLTVSARVSAPFRADLPAGIESSVEDSGFAFVRFAGGPVLHLEVAWAANVTAEVPVSDWAGHEVQNTTLYGPRATLRLHPLTVFTMEGMERRETVHESAPDGREFERQMADFLRAVRTGTPPVNDANQAVALMKMLGGIYQSSAEGKEIRF